MMDFRRTLARFLVLTGALSLVGPVTAQGASDIFLKLKGNDGKVVPGESGDRAHPGEILVSSLSWDVSGGNIDGPAAQFSDFIIQKSIDPSSPRLLQAVTGGEQFPSAELTVRKQGRFPVDYLKYCLSRVHVTNLATSVTGIRRLETVKFSFGAFGETYKATDAAGRTSTPFSAGWDLGSRNELTGAYQCPAPNNG